MSVREIQCLTGLLAFGATAMSVKNAAPSLVRMSMRVPTSAAPAPANQVNVSGKSPEVLGKLSQQWAVRVKAY
jgi:hypothetical protein